MEIKRITENDIINNEITIKDLIEENLRINLRELGDFSESAVSGYSNMLYFQRDGSAILIGAFEEEALIGFLWAYRRHFFGEQRLHIAHIIVDSRVRSSGSGKQMLKTLEEVAREIGVKKIELMATVENERTINFYKKNGFVVERVQLEKELG